MSSSGNRGEIQSSTQTCLPLSRSSFLPDDDRLASCPSGSLGLSGEKKVLPVGENGDITNPSFQSFSFFFPLPYFFPPFFVFLFNISINKGGARKGEMTDTAQYPHSRGINSGESASSAGGEYGGDAGFETAVPTVHGGFVC